MKMTAVLNKSGHINSKEILEEVLEYSVISFDIFDTLIKRNVKKPTDVFRIIENKISLCGFTEERIKAEKEARKKTACEEITLDQIYMYMYCYSDRQIEELKKLELETESQVLIINEDIIDIYNKCVKAGKKVYIISDMYLPIYFIEEVLDSLGITGYCKLYLSSQFMATKRTGKLFEIFLNEQKIISESVVHIGDSYKSDYESPQKRGINAICIPRILIRNKRCMQNTISSLKENNLYSFINNSISIKDDKYYEFGYDSFGVFLWGYIKWLHNNLIKNGINKVYFFSRDGLIIKKAFDLYYNSESIKTYYLEVSRRSLRVPILWMDCNFETLMGMISPSKFISINMIFDGVGLRIENYNDLLIKYGFNEKSTFDRNKIMNNNSLIKMYEELKFDIINKSKKEYELLVQYIAQNDLHGKFAIVDIGWSGGMQRFLEQTLKKLQIPHDIYGYYTGVASYYKRNVEKVKSLNLNGYLFDFSNKVNEKDKRSCFVGLFETLFLEQDGSVKNYYLNKETGLISANRYSYEYMNNGKPTREYLCVKNIQKGALDFVRKASKNALLNTWLFTPDELFLNLYNVGTNPNKEIIELFSEFRFFDEGEARKLAEPKSILYYLFHIKHLKEDFLASRWKIGFMKKLFKVQLPYKKLYNLLLKFK